MREILFRGKAINRDVGYHKTNYKNGDWVYGLITRLFDERVENLPAEMTNTDGVSGIEIDYKTVGQYTGLTDKNGKKIFEGDIVYFGSSRRPLYIEFTDSEKDSSYMSFSWNCRTTNDPHYLHRLENNSSFYEVIGNIHDNPELLKGRERK